MLKTAQPEYAQAALAAFHTKYHVQEGWAAHFAQGQLWIVGVNGATFRVLDTDRYGSVDGLDFDLVVNAED